MSRSDQVLTASYRLETKGADSRALSLETSVRPDRCSSCSRPDTHRVIGTDSFTFASQVDQAPIFVREWEPPCGIRPQATVQITHGIAEHSGRYDRFARFLAAQGCIAHALDLRGHGRTAGPGKLGQAGITAWHDM